MKVAVIGISGLLGTALEGVAAARGIECLGFGRVDWDISQPGLSLRRMEEYRPDVVVNCAALVGITPCEHQPQEAYLLHATAVRDLAIAAQRTGATLVQVSTHAVFDGSRAEGYDENAPVAPASVYATSKYAGECLARAECPQAYVVRLPTLFGKRRNSAPGFADKVMTGLREGRTLRIAQDRLDSPSYSVDVAGVIFRLLEGVMEPGTYHIANSGIASYLEFARAIAHHLGCPDRIVPALDADFPGLGYKPLRTALRSARLTPLRPWQEALSAHLDSVT